MRRKNRGIKLHDLRGWAMRILLEAGYEDRIKNLNQDDLFDLEARFAAKLIRVELKPRVFFPAY